MYLFASTLLVFSFVNRSLSQSGPAINCGSGTSPTGALCTTGQSESDCVASICASGTATNPKCDTENGQLVCAACCPNTDYFVWPDKKRLASPFDIGDTIDTVYVVETAVSNGVSTDCECGNGQVYSYLAQGVVQGSWQGFLANGTQASFGNPDLKTNCASAPATTCNLTLHSTDGLGANNYGSVLAIIPGLSLQYQAGGSEQGTQPVPSSAPTDTGSPGSFPTTTTDMSASSQPDTTSAATLAGSFTAGASNTPGFVTSSSASSIITSSIPVTVVVATSSTTSSASVAAQTTNAASGLTNPISYESAGTITALVMAVVLYQSWFVFYL